MSNETGFGCDPSEERPSARRRRANANQALGALTHALRGWAVFPVFEPRSDGSCSCGKRGCSSSGKHPRVDRGFYSATTSEERITSWATLWPRANWGIRTGIVSDLLVLDIDPRNGGERTLETIVQTHAELPRTVESLSGGGGRHIFFTAPPLQRSVSSLGDGVDVKFEGGYVVAPGSRHSSGGTYKWQESRSPDEVELARAPDWLVELLAGEIGENGLSAQFDAGRALLGVARGERNVQLFKLACKFRGEGRPKQEALDTLLEVAEKCAPPFPAEETRSVVERAYRYPAGSPRPRSWRGMELEDAVARLRSGPQGETFRKLWEGDASAIPPHADPAFELCSLLVPAVGPDAGLIDAHFRGSALFGEGWDYRRPGEDGTTGADTVSKVVSQRLDASTRLFADAISLDHRFAVDRGGLLHVYKDGVYRVGGRRTVERRFKELTAAWGLDKLWTTRRLNEVVSYIQTDAPTLWEQPLEGRLNLRNGLLDLESLSLGPHSPSHLSSVQLNVAYDQKATCPMWERQVSETFPEAARNAAWEIVAFLMNPIDAIQRAILLVGRGANGKSVFLDAVQEFLGRDNVTNLSLQKLASDRFASARLEGKLANVCADLPSKHLEDASTFKQIVSHDRMSAEHKQRTSFEFRPFCGLVFSANQLPTSSDSSLGYSRRWFVVRFDQEFQGSGVVAKGELVRRLTEPGELSGLLNKAIEARADLLQQNDFHGGHSVGTVINSSSDETDHVSAWLQRYTSAASGAESWVAKGELRDAYVQHCRSRGVRPPTSKAFSADLRRLMPEVTEGRKQIAGERFEVWHGIELLGSR